MCMTPFLCPRNQFGHTVFGLFVYLQKIETLSMTFESMVIGLSYFIYVFIFLFHTKVFDLLTLEFDQMGNHCFTTTSFPISEN